MKKINLNNLITNTKTMMNMLHLSRLIIATLFVAATATLSYATTVTVDNNVDAGAQYTSIQTAVDELQSGDTILVAGSATNYGDVQIKKKIILIGAGYSGLSSKINFLSYENLTAEDGSSESFVSGFEIGTVRYDTTYPNRASGVRGQLTGMIIERSSIHQIQFSNDTDDYSDFIFRNNIISGNNNFTLNNAYDANYSNIVYSNNIHTGGSFQGNVVTSSSNGVEFIQLIESLNGVSIRNSIFIGSGGWVFFDVVGATVENNIFYARTLIPAAAYESLDTLDYSLNFNNNITYLAAQDLTENSWFAVGANNITDNPQFESFPPDGASFSSEHNYRLAAGSPGIGAGVNSEDLGIYGGLYPWPGDLIIFPKGPRVTRLEPVDSPSVPQGSTLEVEFKSVIDN